MDIFEMSRLHAETILATGPYRVQLRLSKADLSKLTGLSRATITKTEAGRPVEKSTILKILDALMAEARQFSQNQLASELKGIMIRLEGDEIKLLENKIARQGITMSNSEKAAERARERSHRPTNIFDGLILIEDSLEEYMTRGNLTLNYREDVQGFCDRMSQRLGIIKEYIPKLSKKPNF